MTGPSGGTEVIKGWYHALIGWALVAAVAAVVVFAGMWAVGNLRSTPQTASKGKWGVMVAVVASMLLGGSQVYLQTLYDKWAPGFRPDPASYAVADAPKADRYEVIDRSDAWNAKITEFRKADGWTEPVLTDPTLVATATDCAKALSGAPGTQCDPNGDIPFWRTSYTSAELSMLDGLPTRAQVEYLLRRDPDGSEFTIGGGDDPTVRRAAWVAVVDHETKHAKLIALFGTGPCVDGVCPGVIILPNTPLANEDPPDQPQVGGG